MNKKQYYELLQAKNIIGIVFVLFKSFFHAITQVAWGVAGLFLLNITIAYLVKEGTPIEISKLFLLLERWIINDITIFVIIFFILYSYFEIKEVLK